LNEHAIALRGATLEGTINFLAPHHSLVN
jgi:hypothetical protein